MRAEFHRALSSVELRAALLCMFLVLPSCAQFSPPELPCSDLCRIAHADLSMSGLSASGVHKRVGHVV